MRNIHKKMSTKKKLTALIRFTKLENFNPIDICIYIRVYIYVCIYGVFTLNGSWDSWDTSGYRRRLTFACASKSDDGPTQTEHRWPSAVRLTNPTTIPRPILFAIYCAPRRSRAQQFPASARVSSSCVWMWRPQCCHFNSCVLLLLVVGLIVTQCRVRDAAVRSRLCVSRSSTKRYIVAACSMRAI